MSLYTLVLCMLYVQPTNFKLYNHLLTSLQSPPRNYGGERGNIRIYSNSFASTVPNSSIAKETKSS